MRVRRGPLDMAIYLPLWTLVVIHEQANLRTWNPQVITIAVRDGAEKGATATAPPPGEPQPGTYLRKRRWAPVKFRLTLDASYPVDA
jgi:hypothetical protein